MSIVIEKGDHIETGEVNSQCRKMTCQNAQQAKKEENPASCLPHRLKCRERVDVFLLMVEDDYSFWRATVVMM
jgi:hypothetical protein